MVAAANFANGSMVAPLHSAQQVTLMMPWMWCNGRKRGIRSAALHSHAVTRLSICAWMFACVVTTPFGLLVVPLVYRIMPRRVGEISGSTFVGADVTASMFTNRTPSRWHSGAIFAAIAASAMTALAPESVSEYSHSGPVAERQMGTLM